MEKHRNRRRVMRWLLMSLRMAGLALLALLFARPFSTEKTDGVRGDEFMAILIDQSASMQLRNDGDRLVDIAVEEARKLIQSANERAKIEVAFFDHEVAPLTDEGGGQKRDLVNRIAAPTESYSATDYAAAFRWAHDICTKAKTNNKELHVFTDLQQSGLAWSEVAPMPADVVVHVHDLGRELPNNVAITASTPTDLVVRPGESTSVRVSLLNAGPFTLDELPVSLDVKNGNRTIHERRKIKLESGSIETVDFELNDLESGVWQGKVHVEVLDDLPFDNQRHLAIMSAPQHRVLVVDGEPNDTDFLSETHFLQSALRLSPKGSSYSASPYFPETKTQGGELEEFEIVLLANVARFSQAEATKVADYLKQGGSLVVFGGEQVTKQGYQNLSDAGLVPGEIVAARESFGLPWRIGNWEREHSIFWPFNDPQTGDLQKLAFRGITEIRPADDAQVLAKFSDGKPFLIEKHIGDKGGRLLWVTAACDSDWGNWTQSELYVPIIHQMLGHLTGLNEGGPVRESLIDTRAAQIAADQSAPMTAAAQPAEGDSDGDDVGETQLAPGVFPQPKSWQVLNVAPRESETERCTKEDFASRFELNTGEQEPVKVVRSALGSPIDVQKNEIWHWILFALLIVIAAEFFVSNRTVA